MQGSILTFDSIAAQYPPDRYILLMPQVARHLLTTVPMWSLDVATVRVDPTNDKHCYEVGYNSGEYALTKVALDSLTAAADISVAAKRIDDRSDPMFAEYEAHAFMNTPSGGVRGQGRTMEWDGRLESDKTRAAAERFVNMGISKRWKGFTQDRYAELVESRYAEQWLREREFGKRKAESKAANRAVRALLGIAPKYSFDELSAKEFAVVRFVFTPDLDDREVKMMVVSAGLAAQRRLYPFSASEDAPAVTSHTSLPAPEQSEPLALPEPAEEEDDLQSIAEDADDEDWAAAVQLIGDIMQRIERVENKSMQTKLRNRLTKAIANEDAAQINKILDYLLSLED